MTKERLRKLEYPILFSYLGLWLLVFVASRIFLEMYTDHTPSNVWIFLFILFIPPSVYAALRATFSQGGKWYQSIAYILTFTTCSVFSGQYIVINGDILISSLVKKQVNTQAKIVSVKKVLKRKLGFDHTKVVLEFNGKRIDLDARPYNYFYLQDKTTLQINTGTSSLGNTFVTSNDVSIPDKFSARWLHLKDWAYRNRLLWAIMICMIIGVFIKMKYFPGKPGIKPKPIGFWKIMGLTMGILLLIGFVLYAGLLIYVTFFVSR
jgi:hypothetical protein